MLLLLSFVTTGMFAFITEEKNRNINTSFPFLTQLIKFLKYSRHSMATFKIFISRFKATDSFLE